METLSVLGMESWKDVQGDRGFAPVAGSSQATGSYSVAGFSPERRPEGRRRRTPWLDVGQEVEILPEAVVVERVSLGSHCGVGDGTHTRPRSLGNWDP